MQKHGYCWGMATLYAQFVAGCPTCSEDKGTPAAVPLRPIITEDPNDRWVIDLKKMPEDPEEGRSQMLVVVDHFSGFTWAEALFGKDKAEIALVLDDLVNKEGCPQVIACDNGSEFLNSVIRVFCLDKGIPLVRGRPRHPQTQGKVERRHQDVGNSCQRYAAHHDGRWVSALSTTVASFNHTHSSALPNKLTPFEVYRQRANNVLRHGVSTTIQQSGTKIMSAEERRNLFRSVKGHMIKKGLAEVARHAKRKRVVVACMEVGVIVKLRAPPEHRVGPRFRARGEVVAVHANYNYDIKLLTDGYHRHQHPGTVLFNVPHVQLIQIATNLADAQQRGLLKEQLVDAASDGNEDDDMFYEVESVAGFRRAEQGELQYLIKWLYHPWTASTFEPLYAYISILESSHRLCAGLISRKTCSTPSWREDPNFKI